MKISKKTLKITIPILKNKKLAIIIKEKINIYDIVKI